MPNLSLGFAALLCFIGLFGYFGSRFEQPSMLALVSLLFGFALAVCAVIARRAAARKHAMHVAAMIGLIGFFVAGWLGISNLATAISDDPATDNRPVRMVLLMALICLVYVLLCIWSFIAARLRRTPGANTTATSLR